LAAALIRAAIQSATKLSQQQPLQQALKLPHPDGGVEQGQLTPALEPLAAQAS
jgi:hypothetical protein